MKQDRVLLDISFSALFKILAVFLGVAFIFAIRDVIVLFFIVLVLVASLSPIINSWSKSMPRIFALIILFFLIVGFLMVVIGLIFPPLISQLQGLATTLQNTFADGSSKINFGEQYVSFFTNQIDKIGSALSNGIFKTTASVVNGVVSFVTILVLTFYLLSDQESFKKLLLEYLPINRKEQIVDTLKKVGEKMGGWLRGQITLMFIIGLVDGIILAVLGVPYALAIGLWCGLTEAIPYLGPLLGLVVALIVSLATSHGFIIPLIVVIAFALVQQLEANFLVPKIMGKAVGLSPVIIIFAILIGGKLFGLIGIVLAVPAAAVLSVLIKEWPNLQKLREEKNE